LSGLKPKSIKRKIATIKALFNYFEYEDEILVNPFRKIRIQIKEPFKLPNVMDIGEIEKILRCAYNKLPSKNKKGAGTWRDIAVLELLFATGLRVSEISNLKIHSVNLNTGLIKVKGKGNKERIITVCNQEPLQALKMYSNLLHSKIGYGEEYFFLNRLNKRLSEQSIRFLVKKYARIAGLERNITPHVFRHTFATLLLEQDVDIKYIQHLLGHSSITTTQIYTHVNSGRQREILSHKHPRKQFVIAETT
jgi:integrase/recombinase XerD